MTALTAEFTGEVERLAALAARSLGEPGEGLDSVELAIRAAMMQLGCALLERLLAADSGHRGPRVDCGAGHQAELVAYRAVEPDAHDVAAFAVHDDGRGQAARGDELLVVRVAEWEPEPHRVLVAGKPVDDLGLPGASGPHGRRRAVYPLAPTLDPRAMPLTP